MSNEKSADAMSSESVSLLEDVKKGKPRKYAMICKGPAVISLVVYKKGNVESRKKEAKEAGKGQFYHGVVDGQGMDIRFLLARADGFDKEPVKSVVLKGFLADAADIKCKPYFEIVDTIPLVLDEEDPLVIRFRLCEAQAKEIGTAQPERVGELNGLCQQIVSLLSNEQSDEASTRLDELEALLKNLGAGTSAPSTPTTSTPSDAPAVTQADASLDELKKLAELLKKLKPLLDQVVGFLPARQAELVSTMSSIAGQIKAKQVEQAKLNITEFAKLLKSLAAQSPATTDAQSTSNTSNDRLQEFAARRDALEPRLLQAQFVDREKATKLGGVWDYALAQAEGGNFDNAFKALDRLAVAIDEVLAAAAVAKQSAFKITNLGRVRLEWDDVRNRAIADIQMLSQIVKSEFEDDPAQADALVAALKTLGNLIPQLNEELSDRLDAILNAPQEQRPSLAVAARASLKQMTDFIKTDFIMVELDGNELVPSMQVCAPLLAKLNEIDVALG